mmetsp:Transcript_20477/g.28275  ORF Transcript_20477/g.28275 Transcript_20477/m.28275 type:complete len:235 (+) Transcript_20477:37-741(+)
MSRGSTIIGFCLVVVAFSCLRYAFFSTQWMGGEENFGNQLGEVHVGLWEICRSNENDEIHCQSWTMPPTLLVVCQICTSIVVLASFLSALCLAPHALHNVMKCFSPSRMYGSMEDRDHHHRLTYFGAALTLLAAIGGIAGLTIFTNFIRHHFEAPSSFYGNAVFFWCVGWILSLLGAIVNAHSVDEEETYGGPNEERVGQLRRQLAENSIYLDQDDINEIFNESSHEERREGEP